MGFTFLNVYFHERSVANNSFCLFYTNGMVEQEVESFWLEQLISVVMA